MESKHQKIRKNCRKPLSRQCAKRICHLLEMCIGLVMVLLTKVLVSVSEFKIVVFV